MRPKAAADHLAARLYEAEDVVDEERTSWPISSRKNSAMVTPVSPTRRRAPGGSFIWPNTITVLAMTPDWFMSR